MLIFMYVTVISKLVFYVLSIVRFKIFYAPPQFSVYIVEKTNKT